MKQTFYIAFEQQGWLENVVEVEAESYEEACMKAAYTLVMQNHDVYDVPVNEVLQLAEANDVEIIDEDGDEIDYDKLQNL